MTIDQTGLQRLQQQGARPFQGMNALLQLRLRSANFGSVHLFAAPTTDHTNPDGSVHGGYISTLLDTACGLAALSVLGAEQWFTSLELKVSFLRPCQPNAGAVDAYGTVARHGRRVVFAEAKLLDADGVVLALATSTLLVLDRKPSGPAPTSPGYPVHP